MHEQPIEAVRVHLPAHLGVLRPLGRDLADAGSYHIARVVVDPEEIERGARSWRAILDVEDLVLLEHVLR
jgi:hypothetical protein